MQECKIQLTNSGGENKRLPEKALMGCKTHSKLALHLGHDQLSAGVLVIGGTCEAVVPTSTDVFIEVLSNLRTDHKPSNGDTSTFIPHLFFYLLGKGWAHNF